jgi:hypothetical protein
LWGWSQRASASTLCTSPVSRSIFGLEHLERDRRNTARTRNARLAAVHSLFRYAALRHPEHSALIQQVIALPLKRFDHSIVHFLSPSEVDALPPVGAAREKANLVLVLEATVKGPRRSSQRRLISTAS